MATNNKYTDYTVVNDREQTLTFEHIDDVPVAIPHCDTLSAGERETVRLDPHLNDALSALVDAGIYANRSIAIRQLLRDGLLANAN